MREQDKQKIIKKISEISSDSYGETLYFRPFETDDKIIAEIARVNGVKKSAIAQKLLHLALAGKVYDFASEKQEQAKLDWLINNEKHKLIRAAERGQAVNVVRHPVRVFAIRVKVIFRAWQ